MRISFAIILAAQALLSTVAAAPSTSTPLAALERRATKTCTVNAQCTPTAYNYCPKATATNAKRTCAPKVADGMPCSMMTGCLNGLCQVNGKCESTNLATAKKCFTNANCLSQLCSSGLCKAKVSNGSTCSVNANCVSNYCSSKTKKCATAPVTTSSTKTTMVTSRSTSTTSTSTTSTTSTTTTPAPTPTPAAPGAICTVSVGCARAPSYRCLNSTCQAVGQYSQRCYADGTCASGLGLQCQSANDTCVYTPPPTPPAAAPGQACTVAGGCLGDGSFRCLSGTCTAVGGYLERCQSDGTCPKDSNLACSATDDVCRYVTPPQVGPGGACASDSGCLGDGSFRCLSGVCTAVGGYLERCETDGSCPKNSTLECSTVDNTCRLKPSPAAALQACRVDIGCADPAYACTSGTCQPAGDFAQACRVDESCPSSPGLICSTNSKTCIYSVGIPGGNCTPQGGCSGAGAYSCLQGTCTSVGNTLQPCRLDGSCSGSSNLYCASDSICRDTFAATGPGLPCTTQGGCLGDGSFRCLSSICTAVGGYLERCESDGTCPKDDNLTCSTADDTCRWIVPPAVGPGGTCQSDAGCLGDGAFRCLNNVCTSAGGYSEPCQSNGLCPKQSTLECNTGSDTCQYKPPPAAAYQTCRIDIGCADPAYTCNSGTCQPAGDFAEPCRVDGTCPVSSGLECSSTNTCIYSVGSPNATCTVQGGCSGAGAYSCISGTCTAVGGLGQQCRGDRTCPDSQNLYCAADNTCYDVNVAAGPQSPCTTTGGCLGDGSYLCIQSTCTAVGGFGEPCRADSTCPKDGSLTCNPTSNTCQYIVAPPVGPGGSCTTDSGCLGDGAFRCLSGTCTAVGGWLERCRSDGTCPKQASLYCATADNTCHNHTSCTPECDPTSQGCLINQLGNSQTQATCVGTSGQAGQVCLGDGQCASGLTCDATNTCSAPATSQPDTSTPPQTQPTTCTPACDLSRQVCQSLTYNGGANTAYFCVLAGGALQPCLNGGCTDSNYHCDAPTQTCLKNPPTTCDPACADSQVCNQNGPADFTCVAAGIIGTVPYTNGTCSAGLVVDSTSGLCQLGPSGTACASDSTCQAGLRCLSQTCTLVGQVGQRCTAAGSCNDPGNAFCSATNFCVAYAAVGEACTNDNSCASSLRCKSNVCVVSGGLRQACLRSQGGCNTPDLACNATSDTCLYKSPGNVDAVCTQDGDCMTGTQCLAPAANVTVSAANATVCTAVGVVGDSCFRNSTCAGTNICLSNTCVQAAFQNETCSSTSPCADGFACVLNTTSTHTSTSTVHVTRRMMLSEAVLPWRSLNVRGLPVYPVDPGTGGDSSNTDPSYFCTKAGYADTPCFTNGTCSAVTGGSACNTTSNTCSQYYAKVNESCTDLTQTNVTFDGYVPCDTGLRCLTSTGVGKLANGSYGFIKSSICSLAGDFKQRCLNGTDGFTCNAGLTCTAQAAAGTCLRSAGGTCQSQADCNFNSICLSGTCQAAGNLTQPCLGNTTCNAGLRCNNSTGTPVCMNRNTTLCADLSTYNVSNICTNTDCSSYCSLQTDTETIACNFPSGGSYTFQLPYGISNVSVQAIGGGGGSSTTYPYVPPSNVTNSTDTNSTDTATNGTVGNPERRSLISISRRVDNTTTTNTTNATVPTTFLGGTASAIVANLTLVASQAYTFIVGAIANGSVGGFNGGGYGFYDNATNSTTGGGGGRTQLIDESNDSILLCAGGGGGAGSLAGGGAAGSNGNGTTGYGIAGGSSTEDGQNSTTLGAGAGGAGCPTGGSAATDAGSGGGGGLSMPAALAQSLFSTKIGNTTLYNKPQDGGVAMTFACPVSSYGAGW